MWYNFLRIALLCAVLSAILTGCGTAAATLAPVTTASTAANPADRFAGAWSGTMSFTDDANREEDIIVSIPSGCTDGNVCGNLSSMTVQCTWEMTLGSVKGDVFEYRFSKTLRGECLAFGGGTLTMQSDGTLMRQHKTPNFTASGMLTSMHLPARLESSGMACESPVDCR